MAFLLLDRLPKKSKSSSKALSVCDVLPLLVKIEGFELPSLPKLSTLTPSLLDRVVRVGEPGGLRSIRQTVLKSPGLGIAAGSWNVVLFVLVVRLAEL